VWWVWVGGATAFGSLILLDGSGTIEKPVSIRQDYTDVGPIDFNPFVVCIKATLMHLTRIWPAITPKWNFTRFSHENAIFIAQTEIVWLHDIEGDVPDRVSDT
jgi:hypothetical protein